MNSWFEQFLTVGRVVSIVRTLFGRVSFDGSRRREAGFTLIELLTVILLIGLLVGLSLQGFSVYKPFAAFSVVQTSLRDAKNAYYAGQSQPNGTFSAVDTEQTAQGPVTDATGRDLFPGFEISPNTKFSYAYDPSCLDSSCPFQTRIEIRHRAGAKYLRWYRFGDGLETSLEVPGAGL